MVSIPPHPTSFKLTLSSLTIPLNSWQYINHMLAKRTTSCFMWDVYAEVCYNEFFKLLGGVGTQIRNAWRLD